MLIFQPSRLHFIPHRRCRRHPELERDSGLQVREQKGAPGYV